MTWNPLSVKEPWEEPIVPLPTREELLSRRWWRGDGVSTAGVVTGSLGFTFFLTTLFLAMRGVMDLGGMVAAGGPYEIAHPALHWWWLICAAVFFALGITPVVLGLRSASLKVRLQPLLGNVRVTVTQILTMAAGVIAGSLFFYAL